MESLVALRPCEGFSAPAVVKEVVVGPVVERRAAVTAGLALEAHEERVTSGHEVVLLHRAGERVTERLDDLRVIGPG